MNNPFFFVSALTSFSFAGRKQVVDEVHQAGGYIIPQRWHVGYIRHTGIEPDPLVPGCGPMEVKKEEQLVTVGMKQSDIDAVITAFAEAAANAKLAPTPSELERLLIPLAEAGVNVFHACTRRFWTPKFDGSGLNLAGWTNKISVKTTVTVGNVGLDAEFISTWGGKKAHPTPSRWFDRTAGTEQIRLGGGWSGSAGRSGMGNED